MAVLISRLSCSVVLFFSISPLPARAAGIADFGSPPGSPLARADRPASTLRRTVRGSCGDCGGRVGGLPIATPKWYAPVMLRDTAVHWFMSACPNPNVQRDLIARLDEAIRHDVNCSFVIGEAMTRDLRPYLLHWFAG